MFTNRIGHVLVSSSQHLLKDVLVLKDVLGAC